jgi:predicted dehydrogenase
MTAVNLAIVGFAHEHVDAYASEIAAMGDARIVAGWDHDPERGAARCAAHGCEFAPDLDEMLRRDDLSGVIIGSETAYHANHVEAAARAGKDILLQKPMALTLEDCDRIVRAVAENAARFSMAWQMRCDPQNLWMREAVQSGRIGKVTILRRRHGLATHLWPDFAGSWHASPALNRGIFMDDAAHPADFLMWVLGKPTSVMAEIATLLSPDIPDDTGIAIYRFEGGAMGLLECSFACVAAEDTTTIVGDQGTIVQAYGDLPSCSVVPIPQGTRGLKYILAGESAWNVVDLPTPPNHGYRIRGVARPAVEFFLGRRGPIATADEGRMNVRMLLAAYESARSGRRVELE